MIWGFVRVRVIWALVRGASFRKLVAGGEGWNASGYIRFCFWFFLCGLKSLVKRE